MSILGFLLYCLVAALCAGIAEYIVPGRIPGGLLTSVIFGIIGAWIGASLMGSMGPVLAGVAVLPAIIGSAVLIFGLSLLSSVAHGNRP
jgi:uncharacterized membrane protein YeaQ/YmgE (transglycosylase-associated protein family)